MIRKVKNENLSLMVYMQFPPALGPFFSKSVGSEDFNGVNTVNRQLEGFNGKKGGLFWVYFGSGSGVSWYW